MARVAIPVFTGAYNAMAQGASQSITTGTSMYLAAGGLGGRYVIVVDNTANASGTITVKTGGTSSNPPAFRSGTDLVMTVLASGASQLQFLGPFESAQFFQSYADATAAQGTTVGAAAGDILIDIASGLAGRIQAIKLPVGAG